MTFQSFFFSSHLIMHYLIFIQSESTVHFFYNSSPPLELFDQSESTLMPIFDYLQKCVARIHTKLSPGYVVV